MIRFFDLQNVKKQEHCHPKKRSGDSVRYNEKVILLLLVTILSKALFTLVSGDFMTLSFFTARHSNVVYGVELLI